MSWSDHCSEDDCCDYLFHWYAFFSASLTLRVDKAAPTSLGLASRGPFIFLWKAPTTGKAFDLVIQETFAPFQISPSH
jgi:hypothetical protein